MLRAAQTARLIGAKERSDGAVGPHHAALRRHIARSLGGRRDRENAAVTLDHDVAGILESRSDQRDATHALFDARPDIFRAGARLAKTAPGEQ